MSSKVRIDHDARRRAVARATWQVIESRGLDRTGLRDIAARLGATPSVVTHYFRSRDALIRFAYGEIFEATRRRLARRAEEPISRERLEAQILDGLPIDADRGTGWAVWLAFLGHAIGRPALQVEERARGRELNRRVVRDLRALVAARQLRPGVDPQLEADLLLAFLDGLGIGRVTQPARYTRSRVRRLLRHYLETHLWPPPSRGKR